MATAISNEPSDADLVQQLLRHERRAWTLFLRRYDPLIRQTIDRVLRRFPALCREVERDEIHAQLLSSLLVHDMRKLRTFDVARGVRLGPWLTVLARRAAWDHLRVLARTPACEPGVDLERRAQDAPSPLASLLVREDLTRLSRVLAQLPAGDRKLVRLFFLSTASPQRLAHEMRISINTVYTKRHKLRLRLREALRSAAPSLARPHASLRCSRARSGAWSARSISRASRMRTL